MTPTSYSPSLAVVSDVVRRALDRWPTEHVSIERGAALLAIGAVSPLTPVSWAVRSASDAGVVYAVTLAACTCRAASRRPMHACKHRWAADILVTATERQKRLDLAPFDKLRASSEAHDIHMATCRARQQGLICSICADVVVGVVHVLEAV